MATSEVDWKIFFSSWIYIFERIERGGSGHLLLRLPASMLISGPFSGELLAQKTRGLTLPWHPPHHSGKPEKMASVGAIFLEADPKVRRRFQMWSQIAATTPLGFCGFLWCVIAATIRCHNASANGGKSVKTPTCSCQNT